MKCPYCEKDVQLAACDLNEYRISMALKHDGEFIQARTIGGLMVETEKLFQASVKASRHKAKVYVAFDGIERKGNEIIIKYLIMPQAKSPAGKAQ